MAPSQAAIRFQRAVRPSGHAPWSTVFGPMPPGGSFGRLGEHSHVGRIPARGDIWPSFVASARSTRACIAWMAQVVSSPSPIRRGVSQVL